ncbi:MAG: DNA polymerase III subunit delta [cyanobacterium endosymbiont of Rhopalodia musculus]|uniref:DNA polymerase III subunit delta n=1 Tax=cyanobacterium endosymbiont of Epithemia clementina EcSB TaxID=3034674 RepID=UPI00247FA31F|nr:DNA polymerase III subunit delta [cyanobacterium endosymbiont of Epithemia clementina EcSB]WGT68138.1 DNA polymerase III subunit delta [cyanobacterium endosymbiont of Epithemia clementina EcSB]
MPIYLLWGEDDFAITQTVKKKLETLLDPNWLQFNYDKIYGNEPNAIVKALNQAITSVFGMGERLVWVINTTICQECSEEVFSQLQQTLPAIPQNSHLLLTSSKKPDYRLKSTKLLEKYAEVQELSLISPWKTDELINQVKRISQEVGVQLTPQATELLVESIGNNTRKLSYELEKLSLYSLDQTTPLGTDTISTLVNVNSQNSLQLAQAIRQGNKGQSLQLIADLISQNEPALKLVATLVGQFRIWAMVKLYIESGQKDDKMIAKAADITNPKRLYFLRRELQSFSGQQLLATLPILLELEFSLKRGGDALANLQTKTIELCQIFDR